MLGLDLLSSPVGFLPCTHQLDDGDGDDDSVGDDYGGGDDKAATGADEEEGKQARGGGGRGRRRRKRCHCQPHMSTSCGVVVRSRTLRPFPSLTVPLGPACPCRAAAPYADKALLPTLAV